MTFVPLYSCNDTGISLNILVKIKCLKYIIKIQVHFIGCFYIMDLITKCNSEKQTCTSVLPILICL